MLFTPTCLPFYSYYGFHDQRIKITAHKPTPFAKQSIIHAAFPLRLIIKTSMTIHIRVKTDSDDDVCGKKLQLLPECFFECFCLYGITAIVSIVYFMQTNKSFLHPKASTSLIQADSFSKCFFHPLLSSCFCVLCMILDLFSDEYEIPHFVRLLAHIVYSTA
jgi:hypothetical protein